MISLTTGDSKERLEKAAEEVTGRRLVMTFDNNGDAPKARIKATLFPISYQERKNGRKNKIQKTKKLSR